MVISVACTTSSPFFAASYPESETPLENRIDIDGCYVFQRACDSTFFSVVCFLPQGELRIATTSDTSSFINYFFGKATDSVVSKYVSKGEYVLVGDTIKTRTIRREGIAQCPIYREYLILPNRQLINISDYVLPNEGNIGYMRNYPSFRENPCPLAVRIHSL